ncbi:hypothetical protein J2W34_000085 [Variovorax boronicumulans]|uniref:hypothetical protein n=1 Tax=Variovorax boronicumulans TaxID=436515 RepID=UPI00277D58B7|nr:hypothetical protein [Variovorax boronicumulans]MDQ0068311.1 hypothetical protein [Variovorax boronicumulans]
MFSLENSTKLKIADVLVLSSKNREPGDDPGAQLSFSGLVSNELLSEFNGSLRSFLYTKSAASSDGKQERMDVEQNDLPNRSPMGLLIEKLELKNVHLTGYDLVIDHGMGGKSNLELADCECSHFEVHPKEGGTVLLKFQVESQSVSEKVFGKLATLKSLDVQITLLPPEVEQPPIA